MNTYHVLIVEDHWDVRRVLRSGLESLEREITIVDVPSGEEALLVSTHLPIDLLVADIRLAGMTGLELQRIVRHRNPDAKIIMVFREPVSFLRSLHAHLVADCSETALDFKNALVLEERRKAGKDLPPTVSYPGRLFYSERAKYYEQIVRFYHMFEPSRIKFIVYENFRQNNAAVYRDILKFLEVAPDFLPDFRQANVSHAPRSLYLNRWAIQSSLAKATLHQFASPLFYERVKKLWRKVFLKPQRRSPLDTELRQALMRRYKPEVEKVSAFLGVDLVTRWKYDRI